MNCCQSCGYESESDIEFTDLENVNICLDCQDKYYDGEEPECNWVSNAILNQNTKES
tara:strand:+ start:331 stop:501 length:171 start_codon:yes stop_codon:yes gene_type:complete